MMDKKVYAAIISKTPDDRFYVNVPDMEIGTQGSTIAEAIDMAREAIELQGISLQDIGQPIPEPTRLDPPHEKDEMVALIDVDFEQVREAVRNMIEEAETLSAEGKLSSYEDVFCE